MLASILQVVGLAAISVGLGLINVALGVVAFGASCLLIGIALERSN